MKSNPIFQMNLDFQDNKWGLKFPEEIEDYSSPIFAVPLIEDLFINLSEKKFYVPCERNEEYTELEFKIIDGYFSIKEIWMKYPVYFELLPNVIEYQKLYSSKNLRFQDPINEELHFLSNQSLFFHSLEYIGENLEFIYPYKRFIPLVIKNISTLDLLYDLDKTCIVGLTPSFGDKKY